MKADKVADYKSVDDLKDLRYLLLKMVRQVKDVAEANELKITVVNKQADALLGVKSGAVDASLLIQQWLLL